MSKAALHDQLKEFASKVGVLPKTAKAYGYNYCPLPDMIDIIQPLLDQLGLVITQTTRRLLDQWVLVTTISNSAGESIESECPIIVQTKWDKGGRDATGMQDMGSSITYARRYGLSLALNLVADEDTDNQVKRITRGELRSLLDALNGLPNREEVVFGILHGYDIIGLENLPQSKFDKVMARISELRSTEHGN